MILTKNSFLIIIYTFHHSVAVIFYKGGFSHLRGRFFPRFMILQLKRRKKLCSEALDPRKFEMRLAAMKRRSWQLIEVMPVWMNRKWLITTEAALGWPQITLYQPQNMSSFRFFPPGSTQLYKPGDARTIHRSLSSSTEKFKNTLTNHVYREMTIQRKWLWKKVMWALGTKRRF